jgi:hypothetical protein
MRHAELRNNEPEAPNDFRFFDYELDGEIFQTSMLMASAPCFSDFSLLSDIYTAPHTSAEPIKGIALDNEARRALKPLAKRADVKARIDGTKIWDDPCFRLLSWGSANQPRFEFDVCSFVDYRWTGGLLEDELKEAIVACRGVIKEDFFDQGFNKFRRTWMPNLNSVVGLQDRFCCGGVSVLTAFAREDDFLLPLQKRSEQVADGQNQLATIPKGLHQPLSSTRKNIYPYWTVLREFHEELYEGDVERKQKRLSHDWWLDEEGAEATRHLVSNPDTFQVSGLGFGFNLVTGNYEYCCLLLIMEKDFLSKFPPRGSWETSDLIELSSRDYDLIKYYMTSNTSRPVNESIPSLVLGLERLAQIAPRKVSAPSFQRL